MHVNLCAVFVSTNIMLSEVFKKIVYRGVLKNSNIMRDAVYHNDLSLSRKAIYTGTKDGLKCVQRYLHVAIVCCLPVEILCCKSATKMYES